MASKYQEKKIAKVMREFEEGKLKSSSGEIIKSRKQAMAIAMSEAGMTKDTNLMALAIVAKGLI